MRCASSIRRAVSCRPTWPRVRELVPNMHIDPAHKETTDLIMDLLERNDTADLGEHLVTAAGFRRFLG